MNDRQIKNEMRPHFSKNYGKFYPAKTLESLGFHRTICKKCGKGFWSVQPREFCDEPACSGGYRFIGQTLTRKKFGYKEAWDVYVKTFKKWNYAPLRRYPVVCRWYDALYFVTAGINDFQPYVVSGEVEPPADAVIEPQFCLRFQDTDSVGITGRHYTGFIMVGQHVFNTPAKHVYFKDEGVAQIYEFLTKGLGIPSDELFFHEEVWAGGGNFGPCMEFFSRGLELGNQVYIQYQSLPDGSYRELKTKVIDMGAGLERWSWFSQGAPMSYDTAFPKVMKYLYKQTGMQNASEELWSGFARYAGLLNVSEIDNTGPVWKKVASQVGVELSALKDEVYRRRALYALADHTRTLLVAIHDGALPSNVGGGYNLRSLLRRCWSLIDEYEFDIELERLFEIHIDEFGSWFTELRDYSSLFEILTIEEERYNETRGKCKGIIQRMSTKGEMFDADKLVGLYDSQGITPEMAAEVNPSIDVPDDFYSRVQALHERHVKAERPKRDVEHIPKTKLLFYEKPEATTFTARVIKRLGQKDIVLDRTLFYPTGGGQMHDTGTINGIKVIDVIKENGVVIHTTEKPVKEYHVKGTIDAERRRILSEHHTATHIVNYAARNVLGAHVWQAGAEKTIEKARLDITHYKSLDFAQIQEIERIANGLVKQNALVHIKEIPRDKAEEKYSMRIYQGGAVPGKTLRIVAIGDYDVEACGGTHVKSTSQVGLIKIINSERIQDGIVRLEFTVGDNAIKEIQRQARILKELANLWGISQDDLPKTARKFFEGWKELKKENTRLKRELAKRRESYLIAHAEDIGNLRVISERLPAVSVEELRASASHLGEKYDDVIVTLGTASPTGAYVCTASGIIAVETGIHADSIVREICKELGGSGGGKPNLAQGGGPRVERLNEALKKSVNLIKKQIKRR